MFFKQTEIFIKKKKNCLIIKQLIIQLIMRFKKWKIFHRFSLT